MDALDPSIREPNASGDTGASGLPRMAVRLGELGLLLPWDGGREVLPAPAASRIPNTVSWLCGVANVRGSLVPVVDAAAALGVTRAAGVPAYLLICGDGDDALGLLIDGLPRVLEIDVARMVPDRPVTPALLDRSVIAAYEQAGRVWLDVNLELLFETLAEEIPRLNA
jgi:chemotaxis signal transduction protein